MRIASFIVLFLCLVSAAGAQESESIQTVHGDILPPSFDAYYEVFETENGTLILQLMRREDGWPHPVISIRLPGGRTIDLLHEEMNRIGLIEVATQRPETHIILTGRVISLDQMLTIRQTELPSELTIFRREAFSEVLPLVFVCVQTSQVAPGTHSLFGGITLKSQNRWHVLAHAGPSTAVKDMLVSSVDQQRGIVTYKSVHFSQTRDRTKRKVILDLHTPRMRTEIIWPPAR